MAIAAKSRTQQQNKVLRDYNNKLNYIGKQIVAGALRKCPYLEKNRMLKKEGSKTENIKHKYVL